MSLKQAANHLAAHGRGPDTELVHMTRGEINGLQTIAKAHGGSLTINPHTGLAEAGFLSSILPTLAGGAAMYFSGGTINPATIGMITGGLQYARTGSLQKGIMAGMGAYGGAGMAGGLMSAGTSAAQNAAIEGAKSTAGEVAAQSAQAANPGLTVSELGTEMGKAGYNPGASMQSITNQAAADATKQAMATPGQTMWEGAKSLTDASGRDAFSNYATGMGSSAGKLGLSAAAPAIGEMMKPQMNLPAAPASDGKMPQRLQYNPGRATDAQGQTVTPPPDVPEYGDLGRDFGKQQSYFPNAGYQKISDDEAKELRGYASGGPVAAMSNANAVGANTGFPMADVGGHAYSTPWQTPVSQNIVAGAQDVAVDPYTGQEQRSAPASASRLAVGGEVSPTMNFEQPYTAMARGGLSAAASHLGDYSDGGRLLKGPGDGVSDSIPATIGNKRPARLADGEFVVPARIVSELGNGSTEAGARKLYAMLDRVQAARKKSIGKGKVAKNSRADKLLPA